MDNLSEGTREEKKSHKKIDNAMKTITGNELKVIQLKFFNKKKDNKISWSEIGSITNLDADCCRTLKRKAIKQL